MIDDSFSIAPVQRPMPQHSPDDARALWDRGGALVLLVEEQALAGIRRQARARPKEEVGGVLLGRHYIAGAGFVVEISDCVPVPSKNRSAVHFEFDETSVQAIATRLAEAGDDTEYVVGWYHSHIQSAPYMSAMDVRLHRDHFVEPWHISAVVSVGEWGLPIGFWRSVDGEVDEIDDHLIRMSGPGTAADRHERYLRDAGLDEEDGLDGNDLLNTVNALGFGDDSVIVPFLDRPDRESALAREDVSLQELRFLVGLALRLRDAPEVAAELATLGERLEVARGRRAMMRMALASARLKDRIVVHRRECYSYTVGDKIVERFDLQHRLVWPVQLESEPTSMSFDPSGALWGCMRNGKFIRIKNLGVSSSEKKIEYRFEVKTVPSPLVDRVINEITAETDVLWALADDHWFRFEYERENPEPVLRKGAQGELPAGGIHFVAGWDPSTGGPGVRLRTAGPSHVQLWNLQDERWIEQLRLELPPAGRGGVVTEVVIGRTGIYVLVDDGGAGQLFVYDHQSGELDHHTIGRADDDEVSSLCVDHLGRVYACVGNTLQRLSL